MAYNAGFQAVSPLGCCLSQRRPSASYDAILDGMKLKCQRTLGLIFSRPVSGSLPWRHIEALFQELGGHVTRPTHTQGSSRFNPQVA